MPGEGRTLRSGKETSSSANGEKAKEKAAPARAPSTRSKAASQTRKGAKKDDQPNGQPVENGVSASEDVDMGDETTEHGKTTIGHAEDEEMTVVVPPPKSTKLNGEPAKDAEGDVDMAADDKDGAKTVQPPIDPKEKAINDIKANLQLLEKAVVQFDARFTLRALRSISSIRKHLTPDLLAEVIAEVYQPSNSTVHVLLAALGKDSTVFDKRPTTEMEVDTQSKDKTKHTSQAAAKEPIPEIDFYLAIFVQIYFYDSNAFEKGVDFSNALIERLRKTNRRTLDALSAKIYYYYALFYEETAPLPPNSRASVVSIRPHLLAALRTSVLRKDQDTQAAVTTLLLRNYLSTSHITQADLLIAHSQFPATASNNQVARYLFYIGRIRAIQLSYSEAHEHLTGATRKAPTSPSARGFYQAATKLLVVVELLMGDIPDRAIFRQAPLEVALQPYLELVQAVRVGKMEGFLNVVQAHNALFRRDGTYTLILRLRQNVIKTGIRMMSLSYARISLRDICIRLDLDSEQSAEYIVAKAIRDGVIEATLDHEGAFMKSKEAGDIYATREPGETFHERIRACLGLHDESVKAMRYPMNQHRLELKNAQEARERERELAKEIVEGEMDDDDGAGGDFEGI